VKAGWRKERRWQQPCANPNHDKGGIGAMAEPSVLPHRTEFQRECWHFRSIIWQTCARLRAGIAGSGAEDERAVRRVSAHYWGLDGGITAAKGVMPSVISTAVRRPR